MRQKKANSLTDLYLQGSIHNLIIVESKLNIIDVSLKGSSNISTYFQKDKVSDEVYDEIYYYWKAANLNTISVKCVPLISTSVVDIGLTESILYALKDSSLSILAKYSEDISVQDIGINLQQSSEIHIVNFDCLNKPEEAKSYIFPKYLKNKYYQQSYFYENKSFVCGNYSLIERLYQALTPKKELFLISVDWNDITFFDEYMHFRLENKECLLHHKGSKRQYNDVKQMLIYGGFKTPCALYNKTIDKFIKITEMTNLEELFDFLQVEYNLKDSDLGKEMINREIVDNWTNARVIDHFQIKDKSTYLNHLCDLSLRNNYKVTPVKEVRIHDSNNSRYEEISYLFSFKRKEYLCIVWESEHLSKATFVFKCKESDFTVAKQKLVDFISSEYITNKREKLHNYKMKYFDSRLIKYIGSVSHPTNEFKIWEGRLYALTNR